MASVLSKASPNRSHGAGETAAVIRKSALRLFVREGYQAVSLRQIAEDVGIQVGSLYNHMESKQSLLYEFIYSLESDLLFKLNKNMAIHHDPRASLRSYVATYLKTAMTHRELHTLTMRERSYLNTQQLKVVQDLRNEQVKLLKDKILIGNQLKVFSAESLEITTNSIRSMLDGLISSCLVDQFSIKVLIDRMEKLTLRAIGA